MTPAEAFERGLRWAAEIPGLTVSWWPKAERSASWRNEIDTGMTAPATLRELSEKHCPCEDSRPHWENGVQFCWAMNLGGKGLTRRSTT